MITATVSERASERASGAAAMSCLDDTASQDSSPASALTFLLQRSSDVLFKVEHSTVSCSGHSDQP